MIRRLLPPLAALALSLALGGCVSLLPKATPAELYRFGAADAGTLPPPAADARSIVVGPITFPHEAMGDGILTVEGEGTSFLSGARWVAPASILFRQALDHAFMAKAPRIHIEERGEPGPVAAVLDLEVTRFDARYQGQGAPTVEVAVRARLIGNDGSMIATQDFSAAEPAAANRVAEIVSAYDRATAGALGGLAQWVDGAAPAARRSLPASTSTTTSTKSTTSTPKPRR